MTDISPIRIIRAMRTSIREGHSFDRDAVHEAEAQGLLTFSYWPAGHWSITPKGYNYIQDHEENLGE